MHSKGLIPVSYEIVAKVIMWTGLFLDFRRKKQFFARLRWGLDRNNNLAKKKQIPAKILGYMRFKTLYSFHIMVGFLVIFSSTWNFAMIFSPCSSDIPLLLWWFCNSFPQCLTFGIEHHRPGILRLFSHFLSHCTFWVFIQKMPLYLLGPNVHLALETFLPIYIGPWLYFTNFQSSFHNTKQGLETPHHRLSTPQRFNLQRIG